MEHQLKQFDLNQPIGKSLILSVSPDAQTLIRGAGFGYVHEVYNAKAIEIARDLNLKPTAALELLDEIKQVLENHGTVERKKQKIQVHSALDMWETSKAHNGHIVTFCKPLDDILGGGVALGEVTEFCGAPGAGKTQICTQIAVDTTIPSCTGGVDGEVLYIDTEGSFAIERANDMAVALVNHLKLGIQKARTKTMDKVSAKNDFVKDLEQIPSAETVLNRIHYCRAQDVAEQIAIVRSLPEFLKQHTKVKLIIIDSIAFHFRHGFEDMTKRTRVLMAHALALNSIASKFHVAVVVTNQMTTKFDRAQKLTTDNTANEDTSHLVPALGESWSHSVTNRIELCNSSFVCDCTKMLLPEYKTNTQMQRLYQQIPKRIAKLTKSPSQKQESTNFVILQQGIRMVPRR